MESSNSPKKCPDCGVEMRVTRDVQIRTGGKTGWSRLFWGEWAEYMEEFLPADLYYCPKCEQVRIYKPLSLQKPEP